MDWDYRARLDKAARSGANAKLEVAKVGGWGFLIGLIGVLVAVG